MERQNVTKGPYRNCQFLKLNEYIFYEIFRHLEYKEVYGVLRTVCRTIKNYVDSYMNITGTFMLASNSYVNQNLLIQVFNRNNKVVYLHSKVVPSIPNLDHPYTNLDQGFHSKLFGATIHGNIVIGVFKECLGEQKSFSGAIRYNSVIYNLEKDDNNELRWVVVNPKDDDPKNVDSGDKIFRGNKSFHFNRHCHFISSCCIQSKSGYSLILYNSLPCVYDTITILNFNNKNQNMQTYLRRIPFMETIIQRTKRSVSSFLTYSIINAYQPLDSTSLIGFNITQVDDNRILLVGGKDKWNNPNLVFWQGSFIGASLSTLNWTQIELESVTPRFQPLCFKLRDTIYIVGGYCIEKEGYSDGDALYSCDNYNLKEGEYYKNVHFVPYALSSGNKVATDTNETYALIIGKKNHWAYSRTLTSYLIFKEKVGFQELTGVEFDDDLASIELNSFETTLFGIR